MTTKYSDIVTLRESTPAYNIQSEKENAWKSFIANDQFNDILRKVIQSVRNNDISLHCSFWIDGTYGSGKSHAAAVIKHLLCDTLEDIDDYVNQEYSAPKYKKLKNDIVELRQNIRLLPVQLYGQQEISQESDLSLQIQRCVNDALKKAKIAFTVKTDFDNYVNHIDNQPRIWELLIHDSAQLRSVAPTIQKLRSELVSCNTEVLNRVREAERNTGVSINLELSNLKQWLIDVQNKLKSENTGYDGLFIVWDEFTELMRSAVGLRLLTPLQEITEALMSSENNSYFLFITHPSAFNGLIAEEATKTKGRYHYTHYNMETVSAFKIMSRKFKIINPDSDEYTRLVHEFYSDKQDMLNLFSTNSTSPEETKEDLQRVFPIHPYTANLATYYAREVGSSSRSVFQFLASDAIKDFLDSEENYLNRATVTADMLWDYVEGDFAADNMRFAAVTERYNSYRLNVEHQGRTEFAVFKGILLLNALNNIAQNPTVVPSQENIIKLFLGTPYEKDVNEALDYLNDKSIIQRNPMGLFTIQFSALPTGEIQEIKENLLKKDFLYTSQVVNFGESAKTEINKMLKNVSRPYSSYMYSTSSNEYVLLNNIERDTKKARSYEIFLALFFARTTNELNELKSIAEKASVDERFKNVAFIIFDTIMGQQNYDRFIEYMAIASCAQKNNLAEQQTANIKDASDMISQWMRNISRGIFTSYIRGNQEINSANRLTSFINGRISPTIFSSGPESLEIILNRSSNTYWKKASTRTTVDAILSYNTKEDILSRCGGPAKHVEYLLQDSVDENLRFKDDVDQNHPLYKVCQRVKSIFNHTAKNTQFNLGEKLKELTEPPYGLFQSYAGMAMVAFAMRAYIKQLFDSNGRPREAQHLVDDVVEMFKVWEDQKESNKLNFQFESKESGELCKNLIKVFNLDKLPGHNEVTSLKDARWAIIGEFSKQKGFPLWSLKYIDTSDNIKKIIDNILKICEPDGLKNPSLLTETLSQLKQNSLDLKSLLIQTSLFEIGFKKYLHGVEMVDVKEDEIEEAIIYLRQHLQGEIGTWKENDVKEKLKDWRIEKNTSDDTELRKALVNLFDIQTDSDKLPIIDSIIDIIWGISLASVQYPIWTLKYVTSDTEEKSLLTDLHKLFIIDNYANLANSQELATRINERMDELKALISDKGNFYNGFINYIKGIQTIAIAGFRN